MPEVVSTEARDWAETQSSSFIWHSCFHSGRTTSVSSTLFHFQMHFSSWIKYKSYSETYKSDADIGQMWEVLCLQPISFSMHLEVVPLFHNIYTLLYSLGMGGVGINKSLCLQVIFIKRCISLDSAGGNVPLMAHSNNLRNNSFWIIFSRPHYVKVQAIISILN